MKETIIKAKNEYRAAVKNQLDLSTYAETLKSVLWLYGSIKDGTRSTTPEMKKALQAIVRELCRAINEVIEDDDE